MCDEYWKSPFVERELPATFTDVQLKIVSKNGSRSWVGFLELDGRDVLVRTASEDVEFVLGEDVRLLNAAVGEIEDSDIMVLNLVQGSEIFRVIRNDLSTT